MLLSLAHTPLTTINSHINKQGKRKHFIFVNHAYIHFIFLLSVILAISVPPTIVANLINLIVLTVGGYFVGYKIFYFLEKEDKRAIGRVFGLASFIYYCLSVTAVNLLSKCLEFKVIVYTKLQYDVEVNLSFTYFIPGILILITLDFLTRYFNSYVFKTLFTRY